MTVVPRTARQRGLPSLSQARAERQRQMVVGRFRLRGRLTPHFWLWTAVILATFGIVYWKITQGQLLSRKSTVMARQRAVAHTLTPLVVPYCERIENWVLELGLPLWVTFHADHLQPNEPLEQFQKAPGIYLRMRLANVEGGPPSIRKAAEVSLHDGFVACMFVRAGAPDPTKGPSCRSSADCTPGLLCNEYNVCSAVPRPYNLRLAYRALRVLSREWNDELQESSNELELRLRERDLERVAHDDVPIAVQMFKTATYFTLVLDEDPQSGLPEPINSEETEEQRVQRVPHWARVGVWELATGRQILKVRRLASGRMVPLGDRSHERPETRAAQERQVNSCALAFAVKEAWQKGWEWLQAQKALQGGS